ncbi:MAG: VOC family protein [Deltaproteobacteria bacterium]|nr:VOC family protein [Deltaproteobacteria bacterium]
MPEFTHPVTGSFCWVEANLEDPEKGKGFYGELFGWTSTDMPMPIGTYSIQSIGGKHVCGLMKLPDQAKQMGAPPHWLNYVAVDDVAVATEKAKSLGGNVVVPPMQVGPGIMSLVADPTGGVLALWSAKESMGTFLWGEVNTLCWTELASTDVEKAKTFYTQLFGWKLESFPMGEIAYNVIKNGDQMIGGIMSQPPAMAGAPSTWSAYFAVADCDATAAKATKMGATVVVPPTDIPSVGRFSVIRDPQGAFFSIIKNAPQS